MVLSLRKLFAAASFLTVLAFPPAQAVTPDELFEVLQRIESLENEVRYLRGENEQLRFDMEDIKDIQKKTFIRIDDRMDDLFRAVNTRKLSGAAVVPMLPLSAFTPPGLPVASVDSLPTALEASVIVPTKSIVSAKPVVFPDGVKQLTQIVESVLPRVSAFEQQAYDAAFANIKSKPPVALSMLRQFLEQYPSSALAPNAQYWLGEVMFSSRDYQGAINEFATVLETYRDSPRAPDAAVKLGLSFFEMKNWLFARRSLQNVVISYPKSPSATIAKQKLAMMQKEALY